MALTSHKKSMRVL